MAIVSRANVKVTDIKRWLEDLSNSIFEAFCRPFVFGLVCVNDCAEQNVKLIQDFANGYQDEEIKQNLMLVARDDQKKMWQEHEKWYAEEGLTYNVNQ